MPRRGTISTQDGPCPQQAVRGQTQAGREHVMARHSVARLVRDADELYRELLAAKKAA